MRTWSDRLKADLLLITLTLVWGATFVLVKDTVASVPPWDFIAARFAVGTLALAALAPRALGGWRREEVLAGVAVGLFMFAGFGLQTWGLAFTTPARSGFFTGLTVVLVPLLQALGGRRLGFRLWIGALLATVGLLFLTSPSAGHFGLGDALTLGCALAFAVQILAVDRFAPRIAPLRLALIETATVALSAAVMGAVVPDTAGAAAPAWTPVALFTLVFCGLLATAAGNLAQAFAQRHTTAAHAAVIFTCEPVFSLGFAWLLWGEHWTSTALAGGAIVLAGMLVAEWPVRRREASRRPSA